MSPNEDPHRVMERLKQLWRRDNELQIDLPKEEEEDQEETPDEGKAEAAITSNAVSPMSGTQWPGSRQTRVDQALNSLNTASLTADEFFNQLNAATANPAISQLPDNTEATNRPARDSVSSKDRVSSSAAGTLPASNAVPQVLTAVQNDPLSDNRRAAPVRFSISPEGRLIVTSDDPAALNEVEDLLKELVRPAPNYKVFELKFATPSWVTFNLEDYFKADEQTESGMEYNPFYGYMPSTKRVSGKHSLSQRRQPTFIYDNFTSTILVRDADRRQLQIIEDLINIYDVPEPADTRSMRVNRIFRLQNSKAETVAQAVKDVFRDLLSSNDKALEKKEGQKQQQQSRYSYFGSSLDDNDEDSPIRFKGLLSIGVDPTSDTLVVSSTASLMETISELILELDKAAEQSSSVQILKLDPSVNIALIQERLSEALARLAGNLADNRRAETVARHRMEYRSVSSRMLVQNDCTSVCSADGRFILHTVRNRHGHCDGRTEIAFGFRKGIHGHECGERTHQVVCQSRLSHRLPDLTGRFGSVTGIVDHVLDLQPSPHSSYTLVVL
ncbi:MAG: hypothetical protein GY878_06385 [Fuerstiella sp.]|nr:hypothetical protein [Fuerstiella sp.]